MKEQNTPELFDQEVDQEVETHTLIMSRKRMGRLASGGLGVFLAASCLWVVREAWFGDSGDLKIEGPLIESSPMLDNEQHILDLNAHGDLKENFPFIHESIKQDDLDIIMLQETEGDDVSQLKFEFPRWQFAEVVADKKTHAEDGGYYNVLGFRQPAENISSLSMSGNPPLDEYVLTLKGVFDGVTSGDMTFKEAVDATQEDRSGVQGQVSILTSEGEQPIRYITAHIGGDPKVHERQLHLFEQWVVSTEELGEATVACLDTNTSLEEFREDMAAYDYTTVDTGEPTAFSADTEPKNIDYCIVKRAGVIDLPTAETKDGAVSDHMAVLVTVSGY